MTYTTVKLKKEKFYISTTSSWIDQISKGAHETINHINRIASDNRKENLRLVTQSQQNYNQKIKKTTTNLPDDCGFTWDDIPKTVWYCKPKKNSGDMFKVDIPTLLHAS